MKPFIMTVVALTLAFVMTSLGRSDTQQDYLEIFNHVTNILIVYYLATIAYKENP